PPHTLAERDRHGEHPPDDEAIARHQRNRASRGSRPEVVDFAVATHASSLQNFTHSGCAHHQRHQHPLHSFASWRFTVDGAVPPDTTATPAMIRTITAHR